MNQLPPQTVKRIEEEAKVLYKPIEDIFGNDEVRFERAAYISGATSEAQRNRELVEELNDLNEWKEAALIVFNNIDLQQCGKLLKLPLGTDIAKQILPSIQSLQKENDLLEEREVLWQNKVAALEDRAKELVIAMKELQSWLKINRPHLPGLGAPVHLIEAALKNYQQ